MLKMRLPDRKTYEEFPEAILTDIAIINGCSVFFEEGKYGGFYWASGKTGYDEAMTISTDNHSRGEAWEQNEDIGVRPIMNFSSIEEINSLTGQKLEENTDEIQEANVYLPLYAAKKDLQSELIMLHNSGKLKKIDTVRFPGEKASFRYNSKYGTYYEHQGNLYLLLKAKDCGTELSNGKKYKERDEVFIEVRPSRVHINTAEQQVYFDEVLFAGIPFSEVNDFLDDYCQNFIKLQEEAKKLKDRTIQDEAQKLAEYFLGLCKESGELDIEIMLLNQKIARTVEQLKALEEERDSKTAEKEKIDTETSALRSVIKGKGDNHDEK